MGALGSDVRDLEERVPADVALNADVPLLVVRTLEAPIGGEDPRERRRCRVQRREALAHVRRWRDAELARLRQREEKGHAVAKLEASAHFLCAVEDSVATAERGLAILDGRPRETETRC